MADQSVLLRWGTADTVSVYVSESGGPTRIRQSMDLADLAGAGVSIGSMPELATGTAPAAHAAFSAPQLDHPRDICGHCYYDGDVEVHGLRVEDGHLFAPSGPGLGVELDEERLARYRLAGEGSSGASTTRRLRRRLRSVLWMDSSCSSLATPIRCPHKLGRRARTAAAVIWAPQGVRTSNDVMARSAARARPPLPARPDG